MKAKPISPGVRIGHVHLKVSNLERALEFYCGVLGFQLMQHLGAQAALISAGGYHHHIALNTRESMGGSPPPAWATGLDHFAIVYPSRAELADALRRIIDAKMVHEGASDFGTSQAFSVRDPDGNRVELSWDRPEEEWPRSANGELCAKRKPLDLDDLLATAASEV
jgi:catechol 2,3-dioxygenase